MFLVELVMQGVRGIRGLARLRFQNGFNLVAAGNECGKTTSVDAMLRLLFPNDQSGILGGFISRPAPDASRGALVVYSDDGVYYRVIQDFSKGGINLSKYNTTSKEFGLLYKDWDGTRQFMTQLSSGISEQDYNRLYVLRRDQYATQVPVATHRAVGRESPVSRPAQLKPKRSTGAHEARLAELREALRKAEEAADADYRVQSAKLRLDEIKSKMTKLDDVDRRASEIDAQLDTLKACETLPPDLSELLDEHERRQVEKMAKSDELNREVEDLKLQLDTMPSSNLVKDPFFIAGAAVGGLSIIAGVFALTSENIFLLGVLLAFVLVAIGWYRGTLKNTARKTVVRERERAQAELRELDKSYSQAGTAIDKCMKAIGARSAAELKDKAENYRYFQSLRDDMGEQRKRLLGDTSPEDIQRDFEKQQQEVRELEKEMAATPGHAVDAYSIRQDIDRLEAEIAAGAQPGFGEADDDLPAGPDAAEPVAATGTAGFTAELGAASRLGEIEMETLLPAVESAVQRNMAAATRGKYVRVEIGHDGEPTVYLQDNTGTKVSDLSHATRELFSFCFRVGLVEALAAKQRLPFILDDPLAGFDPLRQQAACQILRGLAAKTQVILFTSNPALRGPADPPLELK
jgi:uncharacterized protein YhaN